jgi:uncharacterized protein YuzE
MKIEYDTAHDLLNLEFLADVPIHDSLEVDGVVIDYAKDKRIVAIELLDAGKRTTRKPLDSLIWQSSGRDPMRFTRRSGKRCPDPCYGMAEGDVCTTSNLMLPFHGFHSRVL